MVRFVFVFVFVYYISESITSCTIIKNFIGLNSLGLLVTRVWALHRKPSSEKPVLGGKNIGGKKIFFYYLNFVLEMRLISFPLSAC
jgi:hypothetical protein